MTSPETRKVLIAEIGAAHGIRGELRVKAFTADPEAIADYGPLTDDSGRVFRIRRLRRIKDDMLVVAFEGIGDRTAAEKLTRTKLSVGRSALPEPDAEEYYHTDLVGLDVVTVSGEAVGRIAAVQNFGADDLLEVSRPGRRSVYVPFTRAVVPVVDLSGGRVSIDPPEGLLDEPGEAPPEADVG